MNEANLKLAKGLVSSAYIDQGSQNLRSHEKLIKQLLAERRLPADGWTEETIEILLRDLASMDSNNFLSNVGIGEREARVFSGLVERRHFRLCHGVGRSGDIAAIQPKAAGSSVIVQLSNILAREMIDIAGIKKMKAAIILPVATGMALTLTLLTLRQSKPNATKVIWPRIDQKSCFKSILTAGLTPIVVENVLESDELRTDLPKIDQILEENDPEDILCVLTTTSCFAPRGMDRVLEVAEICKKYGIGHVINNAYGLQSSKCCHQITQAFLKGHVDACVQSTDKNFMTPVGGSVICGQSKSFIDAISKCYPGRASNSPTMDLFITMLQMGRNGYKKLLSDRKGLLPYFIEEVRKVAEAHGERVLLSKHNEISFAVSLSCILNKCVRGKQTVSESELKTFFGSMLFTRAVSGTRVVSTSSEKSIGNFKFVGYGAHCDAYITPYFTAACAVGITKEEIDTFVSRLDQVFVEFPKKVEKLLSKTPLTENLASLSL